MDDRNLVAVAEQAAATSKVVNGPIAGCTVRSIDGRVFRGCLMEFVDSELTLDPIANAIAAGRSEGMGRIDRIGYYSPTNGDLPVIPKRTLRRLKEVATADLEVIFSPGNGEQIEKGLAELLVEAGL